MIAIEYFPNSYRLHGWASVVGDTCSTSYYQILVTMHAEVTRRMNHTTNTWVLIIHFFLNLQLDVTMKV